MGPNRLIRQDDLDLFARLPGISAVVRDQDLRLTWCNDRYRTDVASGRALDHLRGTSLDDIIPPVAAGERAVIQRRVMETREPAMHYQLRCDRRMLCLIMPLDPASFGHPGILATISEALSPPNWAAAGDIPTLRTPGNTGSLGRLTRRELEILHFASRGLTAPEIATRIFRSAKTVENHIAAIHDKLDLHTKGALICYCTERGLHAFTQEEWTCIVEQMTSHATVDSD